MNKKKPTKKEIETVISKLITHVQIMDEKISALDSLFGLYLDWKKETNKFNKFVETKIKERQEKENEPGETK
tara:strand:- start:219 stop:434 length:216 start_codon:yes stop_codon:yes gene_type:complete